MGQAAPSRFISRFDVFISL